MTSLTGVKTFNWRAGAWPVLLGSMLDFRVKDNALGLPNKGFPTTTLFSKGRGKPRPYVLVCLMAMGVATLQAQIESVPATPSGVHWVSHGKFEGHLALAYSPAGAFSPDGSILAVVSKDKVTLIDLEKGSPPRVLHPRVEGATDLDVQSANFLSPNHLLILAGGLVAEKHKGLPPRTPEMAFQWDTDHDTLSGKVDGLGMGGGFEPPRYFPDIRYLAMAKENAFTLWDPMTGRSGQIAIAALTQPAHLFAFSPNGHWLLLAQVEGNITADPIVARLADHQFVTTLRGHHGTVLSMAFSRDDTLVATACEDGNVRVYSAIDWSLLLTLTGHQGPVHWAEFSPDGKWIVSAGEDQTVRVWSALDGKAVANLRESDAPVLTAAFSPNGEFIAATAKNSVLVWERSGN